MLEVISYLPAIVGLLITGSFILINNPRDIKNKVFALFNLVGAVWLLLLFLADTTSSNDAALWLFRFALFFGSFVFLLGYYFALIFPFRSKFNPRNQFLVLLPIILIAFLSLTPLVVRTVVVQDNGAQPEEIGVLYALTDIFLIFYMLASLVRLGSKYKKADVKQKAQIRFVSYGIAIALIVNIFTGIILSITASDSQYISLGGLSLFLFSLFVTYSMVKHGLFDVRLIVARSMAYIFLLAILAGIYGLVVFGVTERLAGDGVLGEQVVPVLAALLLVFTSPYLRRWLDKVTNRIFYRDAYDTQVLLSRLNRNILTNVDVKPLLDESAEIVNQYIKTSFCTIELRPTAYNPERLLGDTHKIADEDLHALRSLTAPIKSRVIVADDLQETEPELHKLLIKYDIGVVAKMTSSVGHSLEIIGLILFGIKKSGNTFNKQDKEVIGIISSELTIATQNALRFEEIENFNITLQERINDATKRLKKANEKLKALDETKDDFISMASHQLRTPLTSVKGYISMVLEGDAGKITPTQRKMLGQAFISSQRMVYLIADLLNVSRLRTGKFVIEPSPTDLSVMIDEELAQLVETASARNLELTYKQPKDFPSLMLDETKTRQVVMNFVDNAIYYTPAGGHIKVELTSTDQAVELRVIDDGIGVPKHEQHHLFNKFYRAGNARNARPDGTGLGLFMAKKVVVAQGGSIIFESKENQGSTFGFRFPRAKTGTANSVPVARPPKQTLAKK